MSRDSVRGIALLAFVFAAGVAAGVAGERLRGGRGERGTRLVMRLPDALNQLGLTADQRRAADSILERSSPRSEAAMREMVPRLAAIADSVSGELAHILTPAQRSTLDSLLGGPMFLLKRKSTDGRTRVDTVFKR